MKRLRLLLLLTGVGALMSGVPSFALVLPSPGTDETVSPTSTRAVALLEHAARTSRVRPWSGTQRVVTVQGGLPRFTVLQVQYTPGTGSRVRVLSSDSQAVTADVLDANLLRLLASHYDLRVAGQQACAGRRAEVIEALRPGVTGPTAVAGRFWVDAATGMVLRRDVLDDEGAVVRSSAFDDLLVGPQTEPVAVPASAPVGQHLDDAGLAAIEAQGWPVVHLLPSGLELFEARMHEGDAGDVLQLSYSDGLSTLSLFVQKGELPDKEEGTARPVGGGTVWVSAGTPERIVWAGEGRTWTLLSDAPESTVADALLVLPHTQTPVEDGAVSRVWRGMAVVGAWLNPFD